MKVGRSNRLSTGVLLALPIILATRSLEGFTGNSTSGCTRCNLAARGALKTWREVHQEAKDVESKLKEVILESNQRVRELNQMFVAKPGDSDSSKDGPGKVSTLGLGVFQARAERLFPDVEANPPVLAGEMATSAPIVGMFSSSPTCRVPARLVPEQMVGTDDPSASKEENELWRDSVKLLTETLDPLWPQAEERVQAVMLAEVDAEQRRDDTIGNVRKRVFKQMVLANEGMRTEAELDDILTVLQTDKRLLKYLGLLQQCCFEAEKLQERLNRRQKEFAAAGSPSGKESAEEAVQGVYQRAKSLEMRIQACCSVKPDWRGKLATISFLLMLEVGGQQFQSEADTIQLRQGPPVPNDAIGVLMMESQGQTSILPCNFSIDLLGNVIVVVPEFDPLNVTGMNLSVIPLQPDQAFEVDWDPQPPELDLPVDFLEHSKCRNSSFLRSRYQLCGAKHGIETKAVTMSIDPWTGRLDSPLRFAIVPKDGEKAQLPPAEPHNVVLKFLVDSPAAWAAKAHHCALLQESEAVQRSLLESADATCQLLQTCTNETLLQQLCEAIDETALGGDHAYYDDVRGKPVHYPPLLPPQGVVKVLTCLQNSPCEKKPNRWVYNETEPGVMHLDDHGAKVPINSLVAQLEQMDKEEALAWFGSQEVESTSADSVSFDKELVKTAWEVGHLETLPKLLVVLGDWKDHMPQLLMEELVASRRMDLAKLKDMAMPDIELKMLRKTFQPVENLAAKLVDAEQLGLTPVAMKFAENLQGLRIDCFRCSHVAKSPSRQDLDQLFGQHSDLKSLDMKDFYMEALLPEKVFQGLSSLRTLSLSKNQLTELPDQVFQGLSNLTTLSLQSNQLTTLPDHIFQGLSKLTTLILHSNQITLPDQVFQGLSKLTTLELQGNRLTKLPDQVFQGLSKLTELNIGDNSLKKLPRHVFQDLSNLRTLDVYWNKFTKLPDHIFQGLSNLTTLKISCNQLTTLPDQVFQGLSKLTELNIASNQLTTLPDRIFQGLSNLTTLSLPYNPFATLPDVFQGLSKLTELDIADIKLKELPDHVFQAKSSLTTLKLSSNQLTKLPDHVFQNLSNLTTLDLEKNQLTKLPDHVFQGLSKLTTLHLHWNQLTKLPDHVFQGLSKLTELDIRNNELKELPDRVLQGLSNLATLDLSSNQLTTLPDHVFQGLSNLTTLDLQANRLTKLPDHVFQGLTSLTTLKLSSRQLTKLPDHVFQGLSNLTTLNLQYNQLTTLPDHVFQGLSKLTTLHLQGNRLTKLPDQVFQGLSKLTELNIGNNKLKELPDRVLQGLSNVTILGLKRQKY